MPLRILIVSGMSPAARAARVTMSRNSSELPRQSGAAALAGDLGDGASEVQVDVVGAVLVDEHPHRALDGRGVHAVELDRARRLGLVVA